MINANHVKPVIIDTIDYENTPSIDFDLGSLNSFNLSLSPKAQKIDLSPRFLSPPNRTKHSINHAHSKSIKTLSPSRKKKILQNVHKKLNKKIIKINQEDTDPQKQNTENETKSKHIAKHNQANIDVTKSTHSTCSTSTESTVIDLETEYDSIAVGKLKCLQLFDQKIHSFKNIENLDRAYHLIRLNLHSNFISKIQMIDTLSNLKILNLSSNQIEDIQGLKHLKALEELNLSSNRIKQIKKYCFESQHNLIKLILSYNYIHDISGLNIKCFQSNDATKLRYLDIKCNKIIDTTQLEHLKHLQSLQNLIIEDNYSSKSLSNALCNKPYKHVIADTLPNLKWLNMKLFDAESNASKIKLNISSPSPKTKQIDIKPRKKKRIKTQIFKRKHKEKRLKKRDHKYRKKEQESVQHQDTSSTSCSESETEYESPLSIGKHDKDTPPQRLIKPRLISPPKPIQRHNKKDKKEQRQKRKKNKMKTNHQKQKTDEDKNDVGVGITPRIDAVLHRFYERSGNAIPSTIPPKPAHVPIIEQQQHVVHIPSIPLNQTVSTGRIDFLVERLEKLFPNMDNAMNNDKQNEMKNDDKKEEETTNGGKITVNDTKNVIEIIKQESKADRASQTVATHVFTKPQRCELSQDITNDFHINYGWNVQRETNQDKREKDLKEKTKQMEEKYECEINSMKQKEMDLESRLKMLQNELQENMDKNKTAIQKLELQINITNTMEMEKKTLNDELIVRSNQLNEMMQELQRLQIEYKEKNKILQETSNECKESQFQLSEMKKSVHNFDETNKMTNKVQMDRINELISNRNKDQHELLISKQRNQLLNSEITNLKSRIENLEDDKKIWKETVHNVREKCNELTFKLNENHKNYEINLRNKDCKIIEYQNEIEKVKNKFVMTVKQNEEEKNKLEHLNKSITSDVKDLKTLLKTSLQNERKLKKTVLELNDVVSNQNKSTIQYKTQINGLNNELNEMKNKSMDILKKHETNNVIKNNLQQKMLSMTQNSNELQSINNGLRREMESMQNQLKLLENEHKNEKNKSVEFEKKWNQNTNELSELKDKIKVKTVMLNDQNETIAVLKQDKHDLKDSIDLYVDKEKDLMHRQNELVTEMDDLKEELNRYSDHKQELELYKTKANEYYELYEDIKDKLKEKEDIVQYVTNEVQEMKKMWEKEKKNIKNKYENELDEKINELNNIKLELTSTKQELSTIDNKFNSETVCRQKWEKQCAKINGQKVETEQEMRLILTEMERYKKTAAQFAKAFNV